MFLDELWSALIMTVTEIFMCKIIGCIRMEEGCSLNDDFIYFFGTVIHLNIQTTIKNVIRY